jgi:hypothetical protein
MIDTDKLKKDKKLVIRGHGTYWLLPRKKGEVTNTLPTTDKTEAVYPLRIKFVPSVILKNKVCK